MDIFSVLCAKFENEDKADCTLSKELALLLDNPETEYFSAYDMLECFE